MAYLVVRIKGTVNIPYWAQKTLDGLNLDRRFRATIVPESAEYSRHVRSQGSGSMDKADNGR